MSADYFPPRRSTHARLAAAIVTVLLLAVAAEAGTSGTAYLPLPGKRARNGVRLEIESHWTQGNGYRPVKVTLVTTGGPATNDRDFRIRLAPRSYYGDNQHLRVEEVLEIPEGATRGSIWIAVPQIQAWQTLDVEVREGGQRLEELSEPNMTFQSGNFYAGNYVYQEALPSILFIDADTPPRQQREALVAQFRAGGGAQITNPEYKLPDLRIWQTLIPQPDAPWNNPSITNVTTDAKRAHDIEVLNAISTHEKTELLPPDELPDHWLHYTCLDIIVISLTDAQTMARQSPQPWAAIVAWAKSGPTLVITDVGDDFKRLGELEKLLEFPTQAQRPGDLAGQPGWTPADVSYAEPRVRAVDSTLANEYGAYFPGSDSMEPTSTPAARRPGIDPQKPPFAIRALGLGRVVAVTKENPLELPDLPLAWALNQLGSRLWMGYQRNGVSHQRGNGDFMTFLVAGTGQTPVWSFLVLISGFVVVIGPVNYLVLKRRRRLYLLLVTVPTGAAIITVSLFTYALLSDGLGVRTRARSFTRIDQRTGEMTQWSRQSYYAGLAPSGGLRFPRDAAVYPIDERPGGGSGSRRREIAWTDNQQQLRSGYLSSRQPAQFLVMTTQPSAHKLAIQADAGTAPPQVTNQLPTRIEHLLLRDREGRYFDAQDIAPGATRVLTPSNYADAIKPLSVAHNERRPTLPNGYETSEWHVGLFGFNSGYRRNYYYDSRYSNRLAAPNFTSSILETEIRLAATHSQRGMEPGVYVALVDQAPEMPLGYAHAREVGGFHIVEGRW
jgi:hypothetical protein